jgi:hypothetical protein
MKTSNGFRTVGSITADNDLRVIVAQGATGWKAGMLFVSIRQPDAREAERWLYLAILDSQVIAEATDRTKRGAITKVRKLIR